MKNKIQRLITIAKEYKELYDDTDGVEICGIQTSRGVPSVHVHGGVENLRKAFPGVELKEESRDDPDYPAYWSLMFDGVLFYAIGRKNE